jgi:hypothetical protein
MLRLDRNFRRRCVLRKILFAALSSSVLLGSVAAFAQPPAGTTPPSYGSGWSAGKLAVHSGSHWSQAGQGANAYGSNRTAG